MTGHDEAERRGDYRELKAMISGMSCKMDTMLEWQSFHHSQRSDTVHAEIEKRLSSHSRKINWVLGVGTGIVAVYGAVAGWFAAHK